MNQDEIFGRITAERSRQDEKWGVSKHSHLSWLGILMEEVGEASKAVNRYEDAAELERELIQAAAVIVAWLESFRTAAPQVGQLDTVLINYLRGEVSEGWACEHLGIDRLEFRERLSEWLGEMMNEAPVHVNGWRSAGKDDL